MPNNSSSKPQTQQATVGTVPVRLDIPPIGPNPTRITLRIYNVDSSRTLYFGFSAALTATTGCPIGAGQYLDLDVSEQVSVWGVAISGTIDVRVLEVYF